MADLTSHPTAVHVVGVNPTGVLAFVDGTRVRIRVRDRPPPLWLCDDHPELDGRTGCEHIAALADTPYHRTTHARPGTTTEKESTT